MRPIFLSTLGAAILIAAPIGLRAESMPKAFPLDPRILKVIYQDNNVVPLQGKTFTATQVVFSEEEEVVDVEGGDTTGWMVTKNVYMPNMVFIKPTVLGSNSNMTIVTNKHSYYFHVTSNKTLEGATEARTYAIKFVYPEEDAQRAKARALEQQAGLKDVIDPNKSPEKYNWDYRFSGSTQLAPLHVFDDGTFTYFELAKNQGVPAVFAVDDKQGREVAVNIRRSGNYLIVQRVAPQFTLRRGGLAVSVFNSTEIARIKAGRRQA